MAIQIDFKKAFDTLDWKFLLHVMRCFGFSKTFCDWIEDILHSARISILLNGSLVGFFDYSRGVRQGDPLSPLHFDIAEDFLSRYLSSLCSFGALELSSVGRGLHTPSHLLYADDILIFLRASTHNMESFKF